MRGKSWSEVVKVAVFVGMMMSAVMAAAQQHDYGDALSKSIVFFEGQRSGKLPSSQRIAWRKDSALQDGADMGVCLSLSLSLQSIFSSTLTLMLPMSSGS